MTYLRVNNAFLNFIKKNDMDPSQLLDSTAWVNIFILSVLVALIITGMALIYVYYRKVIQLYRMQQNFINGFTHELKTPVTSLKLFLDTFSTHDLKRDVQMKYIDFMKVDVNRLSTNISKILNLATIEEKKYKPDLKEIFLLNYVEGLINKNAHIFERADIEIIGDRTLSILGDVSLMETLVMNILENALTYSDNNKLKVVIRLIRYGNNLELSIQDNGIGILKKDRKNIFKKYFRVERAVKGSGIGLYIAQQIAKLHKGRLSVDSAGAGQGTTFYMRIPREDNV